MILLLQSDLNLDSEELNMIIKLQFYVKKMSVL